MADAYLSPRYRYRIEHTNDTQYDERNTNHVNFNVEGILVVRLIIPNDFVKAHECSL